MRQRRAIRVLVALQEPLLCDGVERLLEGAAGLRFVGQTSDGGEVVRLCRERRPDVLLLDPSLQGIEPGLDVMRALATGARPPAMLVMAGTVSGPLAAEARRAGGRGLLPKSVTRATALQAIRTAASGEPWIGRDLEAQLLEQALARIASGGRDPADALELLTPREREVVGALAQGAPNREVAARLGLMEQTVKHHLTRIFDKLKVRNRAELVARFAGARSPRGRKSK